MTTPRPRLDATPLGRHPDRPPRTDDMPRTDDTAPAHREPQAGRREWAALAVLCLVLLAVSMDVSVLFFAVPHLAADLHPSATQVLWIFDVYGFVLAGLLLSMGALADSVGRRRVLLCGAVLYAGASLAAAYAPTAEALIAARAFLGVGGATLMPSTLAIVRDLFRDERQRGQAVAIWSGVMSGGVGLGPVVAGVLLDHFWWGSVFLVNLPVVAVLLVAGPRLIPESRAPRSTVDLFGSVLVLAAILPLVHALKSTAIDGWSLDALPWVALGLLAGVAFVRRQRRLEHPMVDLRLLRQRAFAGVLVVQIIGMFAVMGNAVMLTQYLQSVLGMPVLTAALWSLVPSVGVAMAAPAAAALSRVVGRPVVMACGFAVSAAGFLLLRAASTDPWLPLVLFAAGLVAAGTVAVATLVTDVALGVAPTDRAGSVAALIETAGEFGGALGMAVLGSVLSATYADRVRDLAPDGLPASALDAVARTLGEASVVAHGLGDAGGTVLLAAREAYVEAMHRADLVAAFILLLGAVIALVVLRVPDVPGGRRRDRAHGGDPAAAQDAFRE